MPSPALTGALIPPSLPNGTLLVLTPLSTATPVLTPYAARGLTQTLELITGSGGQGGAWLRRDVNGNLQDVSDTRFRKYRSTISCRDGETPCVDNSWIGLQVQVSCVVELSYPTGGAPARTVVSGSTRTEGAITFYRPQLTMLLAGIKLSQQEYAAINSWDVNLEEA
jgi:hypothetical protein